jgi:hypothetical protein
LRPTTRQRPGGHNHKEDATTNEGSNRISEPSSYHTRGKENDVITDNTAAILNRGSFARVTSTTEKAQGVQVSLTWRTSYTADELFIQMCKMFMENPYSRDPGKRICKYRLKAAKYAGRISAGRFHSEDQYPLFVINKSDFTQELRCELGKLQKEDDFDSLDEIVNQAVFQIFDGSDKHIGRAYYRYIQGVGLRWKLED